MPPRFALPRWPWTLLALLAIAAFTSLGLWQYQRGVARAEQWRAFEAAAGGAVQDADAAQLSTLPRFTRVRVQGQWDGQRQFLLDNLSHEGAPGYQVLTVLRLEQGGELLVNRGWVPFSGYRERLPDIALEAPGVQQLTGRLGVLPVAGLSSGRQRPALEGPWPRVTSFPAQGELEAARGAPLLPPVLLLDPDSGAGYLREWHPPGLPPERHFGYAAQWWMFAAAVLVLYFVMNRKRA